MTTLRPVTKTVTSLFSILCTVVFGLLGSSVAWASFNTPVQVPITGSSWPMRVVASSDNQHLYVADLSTNSVYIVDSVTNSRVAVNLAGSPYDVVEDANRTKLYVPSLASDELYIVNLATNAVSQTITLGSGFGPWSVALSPNGDALFICGAYGSKIAKMDTATYGLTIWSTTSGPSSCKVSSDGNKLYSSNNYSNKASIYSTATGALLAEVATGNGPREIQLTSDESRMFVANASSNTVSIINTSTMQVLQTLNTGTTPRFIALSPDNSTLVVSNYSSKTVQFFDANSGTLTSTENTLGAANGHGVAFMPNGSSLWLALSSSGSLEHWDINPALVAPTPSSSAPQTQPLTSQSSASELPATGLDLGTYAVFAFGLLIFGTLVLACVRMVRGVSANRTD